MKDPRVFALVEDVENGFIVRSKIARPSELPAPQSFDPTQLMSAGMKLLHAAKESWEGGGESGEAPGTEARRSYRLEDRAVFCATFEQVKDAIEAAAKASHDAQRYARDGVLLIAEDHRHRPVAYAYGD